MTPSDNDLLIRPAGPQDLPAINEIYNHYVRVSTCTFQIAQESLDARRRWFDDHDAAHPILVATRGDALLAWGALSRFAPRCAYHLTAEDSIYVHPAHHRKGLGRRLLGQLIEQGRQATLHSIVAVIAADQPASIALHAAMGFTHAGRLREAGFKFGQWIDTLYMQKIL